MHQQSPMPPPSDVAAIAEQFVRARLIARALPEFPGIVPPDLDAAYRCQDACDRALAGPARRLEGRAYSAGAAARYAEERLIGPIFAAQRSRGRAGAQRRLPGVRRRLRGGRSGVRDLRWPRRAGRQDDWTIDEAADLVGELHIGVEIASSPLATINELGPGVVVSDFGNNWGVIVGAAVQRLARLCTRLTAQSFIDERFGRPRRRLAAGTARSARSPSRSPSCARAVGR